MKPIIAVVGGFLLLSYWHKLTCPDLPGVPGVTSEISGLATYLIGTLVFYQHFWIATTLCVASLLLLELKTALEGLAKRVEQADILQPTAIVGLEQVAHDRAAGRFIFRGDIKGAFI